MSRLLLGFAALTLLTACGVQGQLERPDPLWNKERAIEVECRRERTHREHLDDRCRQSVAVQPQSATTTLPQSPTAPETPAPDTSTSTATTTTTTP
jgi:hypothetical protein